MTSIIAFFKGISAAKKLIDSFYSLWVSYDIKRIRKDYREMEKEEIEILQAIKRAKENRDDEAIKHLMRQRALLKSK